jgi:hypothetical protein
MVPSRMGASIIFGSYLVTLKPLASVSLMLPYLSERHIMKTILLLGLSLPLGNPTTWHTAISLI